MAVAKEYTCSDCGSHWQVSLARGRTGTCPQCGGANIQKMEQGKGWARFRKSGSKDRGRRWIR